MRNNHSFLALCLDFARLHDVYSEWRLHVCQVVFKWLCLRPRSVVCNSSTDEQNVTKDLATKINVSLQSSGCAPSTG